MKLFMTGLDHTRAGLDVRERFAISKDAAREVLARLKADCNVSGLVIISTCNRTELFASIQYDDYPALSQVLCEFLGKDYDEHMGYFTEKVEDFALDHLCRVASGLDSQIIGDDQIITQVREALELSRELGFTDSYIEKMFNLAIQAAKTIKTSVILKTLGIESVPSAAIDKLITITLLKGSNALVIGNGQMGRLVTRLLIEEGANVTVTLRQYKKGEIQVPQGAETVLYSDRYDALARSDIVVSATSSPHYTIYREKLAELDTLPKIIVDLAVPRDIEPSVDEIPGVTVLTVDDLSGKSRELPKECLDLIENVIKDSIEKYCLWYAYKKVMRPQEERVQA